MYPNLGRAPACLKISSRWKATLILATLLLTPRSALAVGELITDVRVRDNIRTEEDSIRAIAGVEIGERLESDTIEKVRERLNNTGLFADVDVYWEPHKEGARLNLVVKDKFPWAPVPTFSYQPGNVSGGLLIAHGNLFGRGKRGVVGGRISTVDSGALLAYQDPAFLGSWVFWDMRLQFQDKVIPEFGNAAGLPIEHIRQSRLRTFGTGGNVGVAWFRRVRTAVGYFYEKVRVLETQMNPDYSAGALPALPQAAEGGTRALGAASLTFDFRAQEQAVMSGNALSFNVQRGSTQFGSDEKFTYWNAGAEFEQGIRFFRRQNLILRAGGVMGEDLPFWAEHWLGGSNLRGYVFRQFTGDTQLASQLEYHFPLVSFWHIQLRGLAFTDWAAIWFRQLPDLEADGFTYKPRADGRRFLPSNYLEAGFKSERDIHGSAGVGIRFFIKSIAVPVLGVDVGRGFVNNAPFRIVLVIGG